MTPSLSVIDSKPLPPEQDLSVVESAPLPKPSPQGTDQAARQAGEESAAASFPSYLGGPTAYNLGMGAVKSAAKTMYQGGDIIRRTLGMDRPLKTPEVQQAIAPSNTAQKIGGGIEQAAEFAIPGGAIVRGGKAIEAATKIPMARALGRAVLEAVGAAGVTGAQTGGDTGAMGRAAAGAGVASGIVSALPAATSVAKRWYGSALKPIPSLAPAERQAIIDTGLREGIVLNKDVVDNVQARIDALNNEILQGITDRSAAGATVDPQAVAKYTDRSAQLAKTQVNPEADVAAVKGAKREFLRNAPQAPYTKIRPTNPDEAGIYPFTPEGEGSTPLPIPLSDAQKMKQGTYRKLKGSYGEQSSATREAQKDLARGLKDQIVQAFPEIAQLNSRESSLLKLESTLERFVGREGNKEFIGLGTPVTTLAAHAAGVPVIPAALVSAALKDAPIRSRIAIALARASAASKVAGTAVPKAVAYGMSRSGQQATMPPPQP